MVLAFFLKGVFSLNMFANVLALASVLISIVQVLNDDKRIFFICFFPIYVFVGQLISLLIVESGWNMIELGGLQTYPSYSLLCLALTAIFFIMTLAVTAKFFIYKGLDAQLINKFSSNRILFYLPIIYIIIIYIPIVVYGSALNTTNGNRVVYYQMIPAIFNYLFQIKLFLLPVAGLYYFKRRSLFFFYLMSIIIWNILVGEKATGLWQSVYAIFLPYFFIRNKEIKIKKLIFGLTLCVFVLISIIVINYVFVEGSGAFFIFDRISMQGQLWWYFFNEHINDNWPAHNIINEFTSNITGLIALMESAMPPELFNSYMDRGVVLTSGFPVIFIFYFGWLWIIPTLFFAFLFGIPVYLFSKSLYRGNILCFIISCKLLFSFNVLFARGDIANFFDFKLMLYFLIALALNYLPRLKV